MFKPEFKESWYVEEKWAGHDREGVDQVVVLAEVARLKQNQKYLSWKCLKVTTQYLFSMLNNVMA
jgi:hypothetical protein